MGELRGRARGAGRPGGDVRPDPQPVPRPRGVRAGGRRRLLRSRPCGCRDGRRARSTSALLVVVGPSGIGKSSVVKAGLLPALAARARSPARRAGWSRRWFPGREPFERLAAALERVATADVPDVVGELTSPSRSLERRRRPARPAGHRRARRDRPARGAVHADRRRRASGAPSCRMIVDVGAVRRTPIVRLVATLRADYFDRPLGYPGFGDAIQRPNGRARGDVGVRAGRRGAPPGRRRWASRSSRRSSSGSSPTPSSQPGALPARAAHDGGAVRTADRRTRSRSPTSTKSAASPAPSVAVPKRSTQSFDERGRDAARRCSSASSASARTMSDTRRRVRRTELEQSGVFARRPRDGARRVRPPPPADVRPRPGEPYADRGAGPRGAADRLGALRGMGRRGARRSAHAAAARVRSARLGAAPGPTRASSTAAADSSWPSRGLPASGFELSEDERGFLAAEPRRRLTATGSRAAGVAG